MVPAGGIRAPPGTCSSLFCCNFSLHIIYCRYEVGRTDIGHCQLMDISDIILTPRNASRVQLRAKVIPSLHHKYSKKGGTSGRY